MRQHAFGIARGEQHLRARQPGAHRFAQLQRADLARHDHVGKHQVDLGARFDHRNRAGRVARLRAPGSPAPTAARRCCCARPLRPPPPGSSRARRAAAPARTLRPAAGSPALRSRKILTLVPSPGSLLSTISPPDCLTKPYAIDSPRPVPCPVGLVVKKGSNARSQHVGRHAAAGVGHFDHHVIGARRLRPARGEPAHSVGGADGQRAAVRPSRRAR